MLREATGLACVAAPEIAYTLQTRRSLIEPDGSGYSYLSQAQVEAVVYAMQSHEKFFTGYYEDIALKEEKENDHGRVEVDEVEQAVEIVDHEQTAELEDPSGGEQERELRVYRRGFFLGDGTGKVLFCYMIILNY